MFKKYLITFALLFSISPLCFLPGQASAATGVGELKDNLSNFGTQTGLGSGTDTDLKGKVANIINIILGFLGLLAVVMILIAGFKWMMAGGNEETVKQARDNIKNAVIGLAIVFASFIIVNFTVSQLGSATGAGGGGGSGGGSASGGSGLCQWIDGGFTYCVAKSESQCNTLRGQWNASCDSNRSGTLAPMTSCIYNFSGCNQACIRISTGSCPSTYTWLSCANSTGNLASQAPGSCEDVCIDCSIP